MGVTLERHRTVLHENSLLLGNGGRTAGRLLEVTCMELWEYLGMP